MNIYETTSTESADAIVDLEDQTGETTLLKASYNRHLLQRDAAVSQKVNYGWTSLHNKDICI
ncbi:4045_t:CDS:2 [Entrophospora sp. SA101]|nr:4045_t:CDS:2 [Entrophospora sp. SA101]